MVLNLYAAIAPGGNHGKILLAMVVVLAAAKIMAELFERIGQPAVVGEILAGVLIGPSLLNLVQPGDVTEALAEIGVVFLLFTVGLETHPSVIFKVGRRATVVAVLGVIVPFVAGWGLLLIWPGHSWIEAIFLGASMVATSVGITARVLSVMGLVSLETSRVILAAAVIDDIIGLLVLSVVSSVANGRVNYLGILSTGVLAIGFTLVAARFGVHAVNRVKGPVNELRINHSFLVFSLLLCFGLAAVASLIGIAGIVGAYLAGVALSEAVDEGEHLHHQAQALTEFTAPFFLVGIGMKLNLAVFRSPQTLVLSLVVIALAILTKVIGCGLGAAGMQRRQVIQVAVGMVPRGEVGIVVAQFGLAMGVVGDVVYGVVLAMVVATTLIAPLLIKPAFVGEPRHQPQAEFSSA
jgi:Kef-type K+ transport system membrane component KefB